MRRANIAVVDGTQMNDEELGALSRRLDEVKTRVKRGAITYQWAMDETQRTIEGDCNRVSDSYEKIMLRHLTPRGAVYVTEVMEYAFTEADLKGTGRLSEIVGTKVWNFNVRFAQLCEGATIEPLKASIVYPLAIARPSSDEQLIAGLGGEKRAAITLGEFFCILRDTREQYQSGPWGILCYLKDKDGSLVPVRADSFADHGWDIIGIYGDDPDRWSSGRDVYVRF